MGVWIWMPRPPAPGALRIVAPWQSSVTPELEMSKPRVYVHSGSRCDVAVTCTRSSAWSHPINWEPNSGSGDRLARRQHGDRDHRGRALRYQSRPHDLASHPVSPGRVRDTTARPRTTVTRANSHRGRWRTEDVRAQSESSCGAGRTD